MSQSVQHAVLSAHRIRVASAKTYQEFQEAQLDLLDFMIASLDAGEVEKRAAELYEQKFNEWCNK